MHFYCTSRNTANGYVSVCSFLYEPEKLVEILNKNPKNFRDGDEDNAKKRIVNYVGCTKRILASYYASMKLGINDDPFLTIEELKAKL